MVLVRVTHIVFHVPRLVVCIYTNQVHELCDTLVGSLVKRGTLGNAVVVDFINPKLLLSHVIRLLTEVQVPHFRALVEVVHLCEVWIADKMPVGTLYDVLYIPHRHDLCIAWKGNAGDILSPTFYSFGVGRKRTPCDSK